MVTKYFYVIHNSHVGTLGHIRDKKVQSFQIICARRCRPMATNEQENAYYAFDFQPPNADQSDLTESFSDCHRIQNFARYILIKHSTDSLWMLPKRDVFKNFPDYKNFPCINATTLQGFLRLWVTYVGHACYAGHAVYVNYKGLIGHTL